jgi:LEA14-like dessication related protein
MLKWLLPTIGILTVAGRSLAGKFSYKIKSTRLSDFNFLKGELKISFEASNQSLLSVGVTGFAGSVTQGNVTFGSTNVSANITIPPRSTKSFVLVIPIANDQVLNKVIEVFQNGGWMEAIKLNGSLRLDNGINIPINRKLELFKVS